MTTKKKFSIVLIVLLMALVLTGGVFVVLKLFKPGNSNPPESPNQQKVLSVKSTNFENRIYLKNSGLFGDEKVTVINNEKQTEDINLTLNNISYFNTETAGKKLAQITIGDKTRYYGYYVTDSLTDTRFNCLSRVKDFYTNYYVGESLNLKNSSLEVIENISGYMVAKNVPLTEDMISGFDTSVKGTRVLKISYDDYSCDITYHVKERLNENITANSFAKGVYFSSDTTEQTAHFIIKIKAKTYVANNFKEIIEEVYETQQELTNLSFNSKITIELNSTYHPSCGDDTVYINSSDFYLCSSNAFAHELAHALDHTQFGRIKCSSVLTEGFAQYVGFLTTKQIEQTNPELTAFTQTSGSVVNDINALGDKMHFYDFESKLLNLKRDELAGNSQYEVGARFFSYLNHRYGDFCGWMTNGDYATTDLSTWKNLIKKYYNNENLFAEFYNYEQMLGDNRKILCDNTKKLVYGDYVDYVSNNLCGIEKYNFYFNLNFKKNYQGYMILMYKDLYVNIESAREQLYRNGKTYSEIYLETDKNIKVELYNSSGQLVKTVTNTTQKFSLSGVSFIKLVGTNVVNLNFSY